MRTLALLLALCTPVFADEVDLTRGRRAGHVPALVLSLDGGTAFSPFGYVGGSLSYLTENDFEFELGGGGGFPGLQLGLAARRLFGEDGQYLSSEIFLAGNTRVNRAASLSQPYVSASFNGTNSLWTGLGIGFEQRTTSLCFSVAGDIILTSVSLTPNFAIHGGIGFGFF